MYRFLIFMLVLGTVIGCNQPKQKKRNKIQSKTGARKVNLINSVYKKNCVVCHGVHGDAGIAGASNLQTISLDSIEIYNVLINGKRGMPSFKSSLSKKEIEHVITTVLEMKKK